MIVQSTKLSLIALFLISFLIVDPALADAPTFCVKPNKRYRLRGKKVKVISKGLFQVMPKGDACPTGYIEKATFLNGADAGGDLSGTFPNPDLADNSISEAKIQDGAVTTDKLAAKPAVKVVLTSPLTVGTGTLTNITFDAEIFDLGSFYTEHDNKLVVPQAGLYHINAHMAWTTNVAGVRQIALSIEGSNVRVQSQTADLNSPTGQSISHIAELSEGDVIRFGVAQTSGGDLDTFDLGESHAELSVMWIGPPPGS